MNEKPLRVLTWKWVKLIAYLKAIKIVWPDERDETLICTVDGTHRRVRAKRSAVQEKPQKLLSQVQSGRERNLFVESGHGDTVSSFGKDLMDFVSTIMFRSVLDTIISPTVSHAKFLKTYDTFEAGMMVAFLNSPMQYFARASWLARNKLISWLSSPNVELSDFLQARREYIADKGVTLDDQAKDALLWTWESVSNFLPALFWYIYFVAKTPAALNAIRAEVNQFLSSSRSDDDIDNHHILTSEELDQMPALDSAFQEVLRYTLHFMISRQVMQDMELDLRLPQQDDNHIGQSSKYFLQKGDQLIMFIPVLHHDPTRYPNPLTYQWDRFLGASSNENLPMRPFGGGPHFCPGRKFAVNGAKVFVAHLVHRYDMHVEGVAERDMARDGLGVMHSKTPVQINLTKRLLSVR